MQPSLSFYMMCAQNGLSENKVFCIFIGKFEHFEKIRRQRVNLCLPIMIVSIIFGGVDETTTQGTQDMTKTTKQPANLSYVDCGQVKQITLCDPNNLDTIWLWDATGEREAHCPMDRVGGPFCLYDLVECDDGKCWFVFAVCDSYFPIHDLVRADSWEEAYEKYVDFVCEHRHCKIADENLSDYGDDYQVTSDGTPVNTSTIQGNELRLLKIEF